MQKGISAAGQNPPTLVDQQRPVGVHPPTKDPSQPPMVDFAGYMDSAPDFNDGNKTPEHLQSHKARDGPHMVTWVMALQCLHLQFFSPKCRQHLLRLLHLNQLLNITDVL